MLLQSIRLNGLLSFGPSADTVDLQPLNVLIGPNGSGKSNFIEALGLLQAAPTKLTSPIRDSGGVADWVWKPPSGGKPVGAARVEVVLAPNLHRLLGGNRPLRYVVEFSDVGGRF